jgi:hypothetical protein
MRNSWEVLKCDAGEGWRRSFGLMMQEMRKYCKESRKKICRNNQQAIQRRKANWIGHVLRRNSLLKHVTEGKIEKEI